MLIGFFCKLGFWQLNRATQKETLLNQYASRAEDAPLQIEQLNKLFFKKDMRFFRINLVGKFDNEHSLLLDNKINEGQIGYEVYTPFYAQPNAQLFLIDRGFIPIGSGRKKLPTINPIAGIVTITGLLNLPPSYVSLGKITENNSSRWPMRIEYINLDEIQKMLNQQIFQYILMLNPKDPAAFKMEWKIITMGPERHRGYALQWFAFALTLVVLSVALNFQRLNAIKHQKNIC